MVRWGFLSATHLVSRTGRAASNKARAHAPLPINPTASGYREILGGKGSGSRGCDLQRSTRSGKREFGFEVINCARPPVGMTAPRQGMAQGTSSPSMCFPQPGTMHGVCSATAAPTRYSGIWPQVRSAPPAVKSSIESSINTAKTNGPRERVGARKEKRLYTSLACAEWRV